MILVSVEAITTVPFAYLFLVYLLRDVMYDKKPLKLNNYLIIYNTCQIILNSYMIYGLCNVISFSTYFGIFGLNKTYDSNIRYFVYIHYLSKYFDYLDTIFIVLRGKSSQLSFLHIYHHATIGIIWGFLLYMGHGNGTAAFGCFINSIIHLIMYSHYLITALGYKNPFKRLITQAQMAQFMICLFHSIIVIAFEKVVPANYSYIQLIYHLQMLFLFNNFYKTSYKLNNNNN